MAMKLRRCCLCHRTPDTYYFKSPTQATGIPLWGGGRGNTPPHTPFRDSFESEQGCTHTTSACLTPFLLLLTRFTSIHLSVDTLLLISLSYLQYKTVRQKPPGTGPHLSGLRSTLLDNWVSLTYLSHTTLQPGGTRSHQAPCTAPPHLCRLFRGWPAPRWSAAHCYWGTLSETSGKGNSTRLLHNTKPSEHNPH